MKLILLTGSRETRNDFFSLLTTQLDIHGRSWAGDYGRESLSQMLHSRRTGTVEVGIAWIEGSTHTRADFQRHFPDLVSVCTEFSSTEAALHCVNTL